MNRDSIHEQLIFLVCSPRSGSTLLQRMLGSHSQIFTHPEPHVITPLNYLGYYDTVDKAPYDHINAAQALREFCQELPGGEDDYLDALRAYASTVYGRVLDGKAGYFLDKTPAYGLVLPFLARLYPRAKYVVLTRHPLAIMHSVAHSFFDGDYKAAHEFNPIISQYVPAIGTFVRDQAVSMVTTRYEDLVVDPEKEMRRILAHLELDFEPDTVEYGKQKHIAKSYGDPMSVERHNRPVTDSLTTWAEDLSAQPEALEYAKAVAADLDPTDLEAWGFPKASLFDALGDKPATKKIARRVNSYGLKRKVLLRLRKNIHNNGFGAAVKKVRYYCDVLLRT